jgi:hypothetical protein
MEAESSTSAFFPGMRVEHMLGKGGLGPGTVVSVENGDVRVRFDKVGQHGRIIEGHYGDHWFKGARAKLVPLPEFKGPTSE